MDWKKLYEEELALLESLKKELEAAKQAWRNARTITEQQKADKRMYEARTRIPIVEKNVNRYRENAVNAGQITRVIVVQGTSEPTKDVEMSPSEAMNIFMSFLNNDINDEETKADDTYDEKDDI